MKGVVMHLKKIIQILHENQILIPEDSINEPLTDYGMDSLQIALFILALEQAFDIKIPLELMVEEQFYSLSTVNNMVEAIIKA